MPSSTTAMSKLSSSRTLSFSTAPFVGDVDATTVVMLPRITTVTTTERLETSSLEEASPETTALVSQPSLPKLQQQEPCPERMTQTLLQQPMRPRSGWEEASGKVHALLLQLLAKDDPTPLLPTHSNVVNSTTNTGSGYYCKDLHRMIHPTPTHNNSSTHNTDSPTTTGTAANDEDEDDDDDEEEDNGEQQDDNHEDNDQDGVNVSSSQVSLQEDSSSSSTTSEHCTHDAPSFPSRNNSQTLRMSKSLPTTTTTTTTTTTSCTGSTGAEINLHLHHAESVGVASTMTLLGGIMHHGNGHETLMSSSSSSIFDDHGDNDTTTTITTTTAHPQPQQHQHQGGRDSGSLLWSRPASIITDESTTAAMTNHNHNHNNSKRGGDGGGGVDGGFYTDARFLPAARLGHAPLVALCSWTLRTVHNTTTHTATTTNANGNICITGNDKANLNLNLMMQGQPEPLVRIASQYLDAFTATTITNGTPTAANGGSNGGGNRVIMFASEYARQISARASLVPSVSAGAILSSSFSNGLPLSSSSTSSLSKTKPHKHFSSKRSSLLVPFRNNNISSSHTTSSNRSSVNSHQKHMLLSTPKQPQRSKDHERPQHLQHSYSSSALSTNRTPLHHSSLTTSAKETSSTLLTMDRLMSSSASPMMMMMHRPHNLPTVPAVPLLQNADARIQSGAVLDLVVTLGEDTPPPRGYFRVLPGIPIAASQASKKSHLAAHVQATHAPTAAGTATTNTMTNSATAKATSSLSAAMKNHAKTAVPAVVPSTLISATTPTSTTLPSGKWIMAYLNVKKEPHWDKAAQRPVITSLAVIHTPTDFVPPGYCVVKVAGTHKPAWLGPHAHLVFKRSREGNPLTDVIVLAPPSSVPSGYTVIERTPRNHIATLGRHNSSSSSFSSSSNSSQPPPLLPSSNNTSSKSSTTTPRPGKKGKESVSALHSSSLGVFVGYRQRLANLECLRPLPLMRAAQQPKAGADFVDDSFSSKSSEETERHDKANNLLPVVVVQRNRVASASIAAGAASTTSGRGRSSRTEKTGERRKHTRPPLLAYYATGGTTVASHVGRYHLMDRSTHNLVSPSSIQHRLALVQLSRTTSSNNTSMESQPNARSQDGDLLGIGSIGEEGGIHLVQESPPASSASRPFESSPDSDSRRSSFPISSNNVTYSDYWQGVTMQSYFSKLNLDSSHDQMLAIWNSMSFIPMIETSASNAWFLQERIVVVTPLLTACYTRHGGAARVAVQALTELLQAGFFADDMLINDTEAVMTLTNMPHLTLLDLAIQCVCDVATTSCTEVHLIDCVEFVQLATQLSQGYLSQRTLGYILRFHLFVFYFGASTCTNSTWPNPTWQSPVMFPVVPKTFSPVTMNDEDICILTDPRKALNSSSVPSTVATYLPGGSPQASAVALKEYLHWLLIRLGKTTLIQSTLAPTGRSESRNANDTANSFDDDDDDDDEAIGDFVGNLLNKLVDVAAENVERANYTQLAYYQMHRSGGSELFWHDMITTCASGLFRNDSPDAIHATTFAVLANLVKVALGKVRTDRDVLHSRDTASKLLSLELILYFLELYADEQEALPSSVVNKNHELMFTIRRMVVPCLLINTRSGLEDPQVHSRILNIISELWLNPIYRPHCKIELGVLMEHFSIQMLQMNLQTTASSRLDLWNEEANKSLLTQQVRVIREIKKWCADPKDTIELFLNYDTDICMTGPVQSVPGTRWKLFQRLCSSLTHIAEQCGELIGREIQESRNLQHKLLENGASIRLLRTTSLESISQIVKSLATAAAASCKDSDNFIRLLLSWVPGESPFYLSPSKETKKGGDKQILGFWRDAIAADHQDRISTVVPTHGESRQVAYEIAKKKSLKKAIDYLIASNALSPSPRDIANFLRLHKDDLDPASLGDYLSETGLGPETEWWKSIRLTYVRAISFVGMQVEDGLRHFLTSCGFRLPGEAQRIDRIMSTFAKCYFEDNAGDAQLCPFKYEDTVYLISFAIIMLNTDLHRASGNSNSNSSKGRSKKMTKSEFINNLRGAENGEDIPKEYLSKVYDSIESHPMLLDPNHSHHSSKVEAVRMTDIQDILNNVRSADTLLRSLAVNDFHFATIEDFGEGLEYDAGAALADLARCCVSKTWHQWHSVINTGLEMAHLDPLGMGPTLEILLYALSLTVCLDMPTERTAFWGQLGRIKAFEENRQGNCASSSGALNNHPNVNFGVGGDWFRDLEQACSGADHRKLSALQQIHDWIASLKSSLHLDAQNKITMQAVVRQLKAADALLQDPARSFYRAANLVKKSSRTGRSITYRFYLFSDVLLYAKEDVDGRFVIHEELPLHLLKVIDWFPPSQKNRTVMFEVSHPRKNFAVICPTAKDRKSWVKDIKAAVQLEMDRKMKNEAARVAARR